MAQSFTILHLNKRAKTMKRKKSGLSNKEFLKMKNLQIILKKKTKMMKNRTEQLRLSFS